VHRAEGEPTLDALLVFSTPLARHGVRLAAIREIRRPGVVRSVPLAPPAIRGLADVRGRMVTAADLAALLKAPPGDGPGTAEVDAPGEPAISPPAGHLMILSEPRDHFALWLPWEIDLRSVDLSGLRPRPAAEGEPEIFEGFASPDGRVLNVLSAEKIFLHCEQEVLRRYRLAPVQGPRSGPEGGGSR
jgi:chemotaxis signal transduction protein